MKKSILLLICISAIKAHSQDSLLKSKPVIEKRHEIGLNLLPTFLALCNAKGQEASYFNATYRYLLNNKHALRLTAGSYVFNNGNNSYVQEVVSKNNSLTVNRITSNKTPVNVQFGIGYERIVGKRKLKHVFGIELTYNYLKSKALISYSGTKDTTYANVQHQDNVQIDTGRVTTNKYYNKFGITPFYSIRYAINRRWLITASTRFNFQGYQVKNSPYPTSTRFDFNIAGIISEISLFYRF